MKKIVSTGLFAATLLLSSCYSTQLIKQNGSTTTTTTQTTTTVTQTTTTEQVAPNAEVLSVEDLITLFANPDQANALAKKYSYKTKTSYEVFRVGKYAPMLYKNCRLAKVITDGKYEDYPRAQRAGVSSYVGVASNEIIMGVFSNAAYENLVAQVKQNGFTLDMEGNEDIYTNGTYYLSCNKNNRTLRIMRIG